MLGAPTVTTGCCSLFVGASAGGSLVGAAWVDEVVGSAFVDGFTRIGVAGATVEALTVAPFAATELVTSRPLASLSLTNTLLLVDGTFLVATNGCQSAPSKSLRVEII